jgi:hypothetical protein
MQSFIKQEDGVTTHIFDPVDGEHRAVVNREEEFEAVSKKTASASTSEVKQFLTSRERLRSLASPRGGASSQPAEPLAPSSVAREVAQFSASFVPSSATSEPRRVVGKASGQALDGSPDRAGELLSVLTEGRASVVKTPGGVGAGIMFNDGKFLFDDETVIRYTILAPKELDGTNNLLYLTTSNRAAKGVEALVSYNFDGTQPGVFRVWDWSTAPQANGSRFVLSIGQDALRDYLFTVTPDEDREPQQALTITNRTVRKTGSQWRNEVFLANVRTGQEDLVWSNDFEWTEAEQLQEKLFFWGPIVETFGEDYGVTQLLGFVGAVLIQDGNLRAITGNNSSLRTDIASSFRVIHPPTNYLKWDGDLLARSPAKASLPTGLEELVNSVSERRLSSLGAVAEAEGDDSERLWIEIVEDLLKILKRGRRPR